MIQVGIVIGAALDIANIVKCGEPNAHSALFVLLEYRNAVLGVTKPVRVAADRFGKTRFAWADAAVSKATQCVESAQIIALIKGYFADPKLDATPVRPATSIT